MIVFLFVVNDDTADQETRNDGFRSGDDHDPEDDRRRRGKPKKPEKPAEPEVPEIEIQDGEPVGGVSNLEVTAGRGASSFYVATDAADELHLHAYDVYSRHRARRDERVQRAGADIERRHRARVALDGRALLAEISVVPARC